MVFYSIYNKVFNDYVYWEKCTMVLPAVKISRMNTNSQHTILNVILLVAKNIHLKQHFLKF